MFPTAVSANYDGNNVVNFRSAEPLPSLLFAPAPSVSWDSFLPQIERGPLTSLDYQSPWSGYNWNFYSGISPVADLYGSASSGNSLLDLYSSSALTPPSAAPTGEPAYFTRSGATALPPIDIGAQQLSSFPLSPSWAAEPLYIRDFAQQLNGYGTQVDGWTRSLNRWIDGYSQPGADGLQFQRNLDASIAQARADYAADPAQQNYGASDSGYDYYPANQLAQPNAPVFGAGLFSALGDAADFIGNAFNSGNLSFGLLTDADGTINGFGASFRLPFDSFGSSSGFGLPFGSFGSSGGFDLGGLFSGFGGFFESLFSGFSFGSGSSSGYGPVVLDLNGDGVKITPKNSSNTFFDMAGDGYRHRTAWAGAGDAVLAFDANSDGKITQQNEVVFTEWDPAATSDLQALRDVFDTNHNGKLDSGDAKFSQFKLLVTNADESQTLQTLAQAGIASIDLISDATSIALPDGSSIDGQTSYTRTSGTKGTAATATFAYDPLGYSVTQTTTHNADGSTTIDSKQIDPNGQLAGETISTTSADGKSKTLSFDYNGDGVVDQIQTDVTSTNADGSTTEVLTDKTAAGVLLDRTTTVTSADRKVTTISRDANGDGLTDQREVRTTNADGSKSITISDLNPDGSLKDQSTATTSADGLTHTSKADYNGDGVFDLTIVDATVVNADGSRTETITETNANGSLRDKTVTTYGAAGLPKTVKDDYNGDGIFDLTTVSSVVVNADNSTTTTTTETNANGSLRDKTIVTISADGLSKATKADINGDGVFDLTTNETTIVNADGSRTETVQDFNSNGSLRDKSVTTKGADGRSRTIQIDLNGDGKWDQVETIVLAANAVSTDTVSTFKPNAALLAKTTTTTSADGLSKSIAVDVNGDGVVDLSTSETTVKNANGSSNTTQSDFNGNGSLRDKIVTMTSANGLTQTIQTDQNGDGVFDTTISDATVVNADGSRTETSTTRSSNGTLLAQAVTSTSADRKTTSSTRDINGDGKNDQTETIVTQSNGSTIDTVSNLNLDGTLRDRTVTTSSATGLSTTVQADSNGDGTFDLTTTDVIVLNSDGSRTETVTQKNANGSVRGKTVTVVSANGLSTTVQVDANGDGTFDLTTTDVTVLNTDGSRTETVTEKNANGSTRDKSVTTVSASGLSKTIQFDFDGNGAIDRTQSSVVVLNANGSQTETLSNTNANGTLRDKTVTTTSADGRSISISSDTNGDGKTDQTESIATAADGAVTDTVIDLNPNGSIRDKVTTTTSADGKTITVARDLNGDGATDITTSTTTVLNANGSTATTTRNYAGSTLTDSTVVVTSADGRTITTSKDINGDGTVDQTTTDVVVVDASGNVTETTTDKNGNGALRNQVITSTSSNGNTVSITRDVNGDGKIDQTQTTVIQQNGSTVDTITDFNVSGAVTDRKITTTSANGLSTTVQLDTNGDGVVDETLTDATVLNSDGSRTETFSSTIRSVSIVTTTSADGLSKGVQWSGWNGYDSIAQSQADVITLNADGSKTETISDFSPTGALKNKSVTTVSANGLTKSVQLDVNGDGRFDNTDTTVTSVDGSQTETLVFQNVVTGSLARKDVFTKSVDGLTSSLQRDTNGDGVFDHFERNSVNADGSTTDTIWDTSAGGALADKAITTTSSNGLSRTVQMDSNGDGAFDLRQTVATVLNADGSRVDTLSDYNASGVLKDRTITTSSANGLVKTSQFDLNGDGAIEETQTDKNVINTDGSRTRTVITSYADGSTKDKTIVNTTADGLTTSTSIYTNGKSTADRTDLAVTGADGSKTDTVTYFNASGAQTSQVTTTTSFDGRVTSVSSSNGITQTTRVLPGANGSYGWMMTDSTVGGPSFNQLELSNYYIRGYATHTIDSNNVDTWVWNESPTNTIEWTTFIEYQARLYPFFWSKWEYNSGAAKSITIDLATEEHDIAVAKRIYDVALDRDMAAKEIQFLPDYFVNNLVDENRLANDLLNSTEFGQKYGSLTNLQFVERVYQNALGRDASTSEAAGYVSKLNAGTLSRAAMLVAVAGSAEHVADGNVHAVTNNTAIGNAPITLDHTTDVQVASDIARRLYVVGLGRDPAAWEISLRAQQILSNSTSESQIATEIVISAEFSSKYGTTSSSDFVSVIFVNAYGRLPTSSEVQTWVGALDAGSVSRADFLDAVAQSPDHPPTAALGLAYLDVTTSNNTIHVGGLPITFENGSGGTVTSSGSAITVKSNTNISVIGTSDPVSVLGTGNQALISSNTLAVAAGAGISITGSGDTVTAGANAFVSVNGNNDVVNAGNGSTVNSTGGIVQTVVTGYQDVIVGWYWYWPIIASVPVYGTQDLSNKINLDSGNINIGANSTAVVNGSNDNITISGSSTVTVNGNGDNFIFHSNFGQDVINGFNSTDTMQFDHSVFADWAHLLGATSQSGADTIITVDAADTITLKNVAVSSLNQSQFHFA